MRRRAARGPGHWQALGGSLELGPCPAMPCEPRTPRAGKPETSPGKVCVGSERPRTRACGGWACGPRAEASCPWAPGGAQAGDGGSGPAVRLTGGWHTGGQRGGRLRNMRRRPPRAPPRPAACLSPGQAEPTRGPHPAQDRACAPRGRPLPGPPTPSAGSSAATGHPGPHDSFRFFPVWESASLCPGGPGEECGKDSLGRVQ